MRSLEARMHEPLTMAIAGMGRPRMVMARPSMRSFHMWALARFRRIIAWKSPPAENEVSPAPVTTAHAMDGSSRVERSAWIISSRLCSRKAFWTRGRLMVTQATPSFTSKRMSAYVVIAVLLAELGLDDDDPEGLVAEGHVLMGAAG